MSNQSVNIREAFQARPGYYFMDPDYSQIEFRLSAAMAGERALLIGFREGKDYYNTVYASMTGGQKTADDVTKQERQVGKVLALGQQYDQGPGGLARKLGCTLDTAKGLQDQYWSGLAATARAKEQALQFALQNGYVLTWFGFKRYLPELKSDNRALRGKAMRSVWSTRIQGTAANWMKIAMLRAGRALRQQNRDAHLLLTVHDELLFEVSFNEPILEIESLILQAMEFKVPGLPVDHPDLYPDGFYCPAQNAYGLNWGNLFDDIEDVVKKGKSVQGWRSYCKANGIPVNFDDPRPEMLEIDFVAKPSTTPRVYVEPRKKVEALDSNEGKFIGCGRLDPVDAVVAWAKGNPPQDSMQQMALPHVMIPVETDEVIQLEKAPKESRVQHPTAAPKVPVPVVTVEAPAGGWPTPEVTVQVKLQEPIIYIKTEVVLDQPMDLAEKPANGHSAGSNGSGTTPSNNDFTYPCVVVKTNEELTKKKIEFLKALISKYAGDYWVYIEYQGKIIRAGDTLKVNPSPEMLTYLKKAFGEKTTHEIFDQKESKGRGKINFV